MTRPPGQMAFRSLRIMPQIGGAWPLFAKTRPGAQNREKEGESGDRNLTVPAAPPAQLTRSSATEIGSAGVTFCGSSSFFFRAFGRSLSA